MQKGTVISHMVSSGTQYGVMAGIVTGILFGFPLFGIGAIFGLFIGAVIGFGLGIALGLITGIITTVFFFPFENAKRYRLSVALVCGVLAAISMFRVSHSLFNPVNEAGTEYWYIGLPLAGAFWAIVISQRLATWYIKVHKSSLNS